MNDTYTLLLGGLLSIAGGFSSALIIEKLRIRSDERRLKTDRAEKCIKALLQMERSVHRLEHKIIWEQLGKNLIKDPEIITRDQFNLNDGLDNPLYTFVSIAPLYFSKLAALVNKIESAYIEMQHQHLEFMDLYSSRPFYNRTFTSLSELREDKDFLQLMNETMETPYVEFQKNKSLFLEKIRARM